MGNTPSTKQNITQKYNTNIISKSDINIINESLQEFVVDVIIKDASMCSANISQIQIFDMSGTQIKGDLNLDIDQTQANNINFDCIQVSKMQNNIANGLLDKILQSIDNNYDASTITNLDATANAKTTSGLLNLDLLNKTESNMNISYDYNQTNIHNKNITNIVRNSIVNNLHLESIQDCINNVKQTQSIDLRNIVVDGNAVVAAKQNQVAELITKCIQNNNFVSDITNNIFSDLNVDIKDDIDIGTNVDTNIDVTTETDKKGPIDSINDGINTILTNSSFTIIAGLIIFVILIVIILMFILLLRKKS